MIVRNSQRAREDAARVIANGGVIAFRTDTLYGLGADPFNPQAVARVRHLKGGEENKPILLLIADEKQVDRFSSIQPPGFAALTKRFWPGPLTIVIKARDDLPEALTAGGGTIGVRLPDNVQVRDLVRTCGGALTATSANPSGKLPALTAAEVEDYFPRDVDLIIDGGEVLMSDPSTVLDLSGIGVQIIREGVVPRKLLAKFLS
jgi:L-threonylcarbamoyladenylate synthase